MRSCAAIAVLVLLLGACGGGGSGPSDDTGKANAAVLTSADLPSEWTVKASSDSSSSSSDDANDKAISDCLTQATGLSSDQADPKHTAKVQAKFDTGAGVDSQELDAEVEYFESGDPLHSQLDALATHDVSGCFETAFQTGFSARGLTMSDFAMTSEVLHGVGDEGLSLHCSSTLSSQGKSVPFKFEINEVRVGRVGLTVTAIALGQDPAHELAIQAAHTMAGRVRQ